MTQRPLLGRRGRVDKDNSSSISLLIFRNSMLITNSSRATHSLARPHKHKLHWPAVHPRYHKIQWIKKPSSKPKWQRLRDRSRGIRSKAARWRSREAKRIMGALRRGHRQPIQSHWRKTARMLIQSNLPHQLKIKSRPAWWICRTRP